MRTGALRGVEREIVGSRIAITDTRGGTHEAFREIFDCIGVLVEDHDEAFALLHGNQNTFLQPFVRGIGRSWRLRFNL